MALLLTLSARGGQAQGTRVAVLVELFTSEGCATCPSAAALLESLREQPVDGALIVPMALHVDYFNHLGWKDRFSSPSFTARQVEYSKLLGSGDVFTPQIIVDGRNAVVGNDGEQVRNAIASAADRSHLPIGMTAQAAAGRARLAIALPAAPAGAETILPLAALTQSGLSSVVTRGENGGRTLRHGSVVRTIKRLDALKGAASNASVEMSLDRGWGADGFEAVVWLQGVSSRQVYGAAIASLGK